MSRSTPLVSIAVTLLLEEVLRKNDINPALCSLICDEGDVGQSLTKDPCVNLLSFTGSTVVGRIVGQQVQARFGKATTPSSSWKTLTSTVVLVFSELLVSVARRVIVHEAVHDEVVDRMIKAYKQIENRIGDPLDAGTLIGPLHNEVAVLNYKATIAESIASGGRVVVGGKIIDRPGNYVLKVGNFDEAVAVNNEAKQGLSSSVFTQNIGNIFKWLGPEGSDCGIVNVNIPTNGAEIGGAFGARTSSSRIRLVRCQVFDLTDNGAINNSVDDSVHDWYWSADLLKGSFDNEVDVNHETQPFCHLV
uniref:Aldedh domain-containing protein n=2 Tax=Panagrellus redivivus TaxID=6233 RepID=A0A7E4VY06_PANRE